MNTNQQPTPRCIIFSPQAYLRILTTVWLLISLHPFRLLAAPALDLWDSLGDVGEGFVDVVSAPADLVGGLVTKAVGVDSTMKQVERNIAKAGAEARSAIYVASDETQQVMRVAGDEVEQAVAQISDETQEVILIASHETQQVIHTAGDEADRVARTVGQQAQDVVVVASREGQQVLHVAGHEARATAATIGKETQDVIIIASKEAQNIIEKTGDEAQQLTRVAGEEARRTIERFRQESERFANTVSMLYQNNVDFTIDRMDQGSQRLLRNVEATLVRANDLFTADLMMVESSVMNTIDKASGELQENIRVFEESQKEVIIYVGETAILVVDRVTNSIIVITAIIMLGLGILLFTYLFFTHQLPNGVAARLVFGFIVLFLTTFGTLLLSPPMRAYAMSSTQLGVRATIERSTRPEVAFVTPTQLLRRDADAVIEIFGRNLQQANAGLKITLNDQPLRISTGANHRITVPLPATTLAQFSDRDQLLLSIQFHAQAHEYFIPIQLPPRKALQPIQTSAQSLTPPPTATPQATPTIPPAAYLLVTRPLNIRSGPGNYAIIGNSAADATLVATGKCSNVDWWRIDRQGEEGWVWNGLVTQQNNVAVTELVCQYLPFPIITPTVIATPTPTPVICQEPATACFTASAFQINAGQELTLGWCPVQNAENVAIVANSTPIGVALAGQLKVAPQQSITYTLIAGYCGGEKTKVLGQIPIEVTQKMLPTPTPVPPTPVPQPVLIPFDHAAWGWVQGATRNEGKLVNPWLFEVASGEFTEQWATANSALRFGIVVTGDFVAEVKMTYTPTFWQQFAGLGIMSSDDPTTWIRIGKLGGMAPGFSTPGAYLVIDQSSNGQSSKLGDNVAVSQSDTVHLKIIRQGSSISLFYWQLNSGWIGLAEDHDFALPSEVFIYLTAFAWGDSQAHATFEDFKFTPLN